MRLTASFVKFVCAAAVLFDLALVTSPAAPSYEVVHAFEVGPRAPVGAVHLADDGAIYGITMLGGKNGGGSIYRTEPGGEPKILHHFPALPPTFNMNSAGLVQGPDGALYALISFWEGGGNSEYPGSGSLIRITLEGVYSELLKFTGQGGAFPGALPRGLPAFDREGNLYGTTGTGGANGEGTLFRLTPDGVFSVLAIFQGDAGPVRGKRPNGIILHSDGKIYGVTESGGTAGHGTFFSCTVDGQFVTLFSFTSNGAFPGSSPTSLIEGPDGKIYGSTLRGGAADLGTIFSVTPNGEFRNLVQFTLTSRAPGAVPSGQMVFRGDSYLYGTTKPFETSGMLYKMSPAGELTSLVRFIQPGYLGDSTPMGLIAGLDGALYGAASPAANNGKGRLFKLTPANEVQTILVFPGDTSGTTPNGGVTEGPDGALYGTTFLGGIADFGTIFRLSRSGEFQQVVDFTGSDGPNPGSYPTAPLTVAPDGTIFGMTNSEGAKKIFSVSPTGSFATVADFKSSSAFSPSGFPTGRLERDASGNLYGLTNDYNQVGPGPRSGTVFKVTSTGTLAVLHYFTWDGPSHPGSGLVLGPDGNYYGSTSGSPVTGKGGSLFKITPPGEFSSLFTFPAGAPQYFSSTPHGLLHLDAQGNIYGTTPAGGVHSVGSVFKWSAAAGLSTIGSFDPTGTSATFPHSGVVRAQDGFLYGVTENGGLHNRGAVFRQAESGPPETIFSFTEDVGSPPGHAPLTAASDGNLYGVTTFGGPLGGGVVFRLRFGRAADTLQAVAITPRSGGLRVTVGAGTESAQLTFEYGESPSLGLETGPLTIPASQTPTETAVEIAGLRPGTRYFFRAKIVTATGTQRGEIQFFDTLTLPVAVSLPATNATLDSVILHGKTSSVAAPAKAYFEWGLGENLQFRTADESVNADGVELTYSAQLGSLMRGTTYRFRAVAESVTGVSVGELTTFTTLPNHAPLAVLDEALMPAAGRKVFVPVRANDSDEDGDALTVTAVSPPQHGSAEIKDGNIEYVSSASFPGSDTFTYEVTDGFATVVGTVNIVGFPQLSGSYTAVIADERGPHGVVEIQLTPKGGFTGALGLKGKRSAFSGVFDDEGKASLAVGKSDTLKVRMRLELDGSIVGEVEAGGSTGTFTAPVSVGSKPAPDQRRFTARLVADSNRGWVAIGIKGSRMALLNGRLEDATPFLASGTVRDDQIVCVHGKLAGSAGGYLAGEFNLAALGSVATVFGVQRSQGVTVGGSGFYRTVTAETFPYSPSGPRTFPLLLGADRRLQFRFTNSEGSQGAALQATVDPSGRVKFSDPATRSSASYLRNTGVFTGRTLLLPSGKPTAFSGVFLQGAERGEGMSGKGASAGMVTIENAQH